MRTRAGGRVYGTDWVHVFRMQDGKIVGFREYTDTATIVEALRQPVRPSPAFTEM
jgi:ketosteroid isomerase-like protein